MRFLRVRVWGVDRVSATEPLRVGYAPATGLPFG